MAARVQFIFADLLKHASTPWALSLSIPAIFTGESDYLGHQRILVLYEQSHAHVHPKSEVNISTRFFINLFTPRSGLHRGGLQNDDNTGE